MSRTSKSLSIVRLLTISHAVTLLGALIVWNSLIYTALVAQSSKGSVTGRIMDSAGAILQGASIQLQPGGASAASTMQGEFTISDLPPGPYKITVTYVGFTPFTSDVNVTPGPT